MQTLQTAKDLSKFKRKQAFIMVNDSTHCGFNKNTVGTLSSSDHGESVVKLKPLRSKKVKAFVGTVEVNCSTLYENIKDLVPFTIGMSVKPQEGWKVIKP